MARSAFFAVGTVMGFALGLGAMVVAPAVKEHLLSTNHQPYAGQQERRISSLSEQDIASLEKGEGWGLAKPAELNGYPGPAHVLEFAEKLALDRSQKQGIEAAYDDMKSKAIELGKALVTAEAALDEAFKTGDITRAVLDERLQVAEQIRAALRSVHLDAHLQITPILSAEQKLQYAELRGYNGSHDGHSGH